MRNNRQVGTEQERIAAEFLRQRGYEILEHNFRCHQGEIDIIAREESYLVFVEVKFRCHTQSGMPAEAITKRKQQIIYRVAEYYLYHHGISQNQPCRFDAVLILGENIELIRNAFGGM